MITKKTLGNIENVTVASFGFGTMRVTSGVAQKEFINYWEKFAK